MQKVGVVVVTYNRLELLKEVVDSLRHQTCGDFQVVVVNNGSTDGTPQWLERQPDIITLTQPNLGGAGGFHTGMKYVAEQGYEYCWVMDDDVICAPDALEELLKAHAAKDGIGFVCSKVVGTDGRPMNTPKVDVRPTANGYADYYELSDHGMIKVLMATFVSVLLSTRVVAEVGLPYKEYFIWGDDFEYTSRISARRDCYVACRSLVVHKRRLQMNLSFENEKDASRMSNYFYAMRNSFHLHRAGASRLRLFLRYSKLACRALQFLFRGDFTRLGIMVKVLRAIPSFHPSIVYPAAPAADNV